MRGSLVALAFLGLAACAAARGEEEAAVEETRPFSIEASLDYTTEYFFRGYKIMDGSEGLIFQPAAELTLNRFEKCGIGIEPYVGAWMNFTTNPTGERNWENWSEVDLCAGVTLDKGNWSLELLYTQYIYPNGSWQSSGELGFILGYDDAECAASLHLPFALNPHIGFYQQVYDNADDRCKSYLELGIRPEFEEAFGCKQLTIGVPLLLGNSTDEFYTSDDGDNEFFGYASLGVEAQYQLTEIWFVTLALEYDYLMANSLRQANDDSSHAFIGKLGVGFTY